MVKPRWLDRWYWSYFSKPASDRAVYRYVLDRRIDSVLEIGVGSAVRTKKLLDLLAGQGRTSPLRYVGVDLFESASDVKPHIRLKDLHRLLAERCVKGYLMPGNPKEALPRLARTIQPCELVIVDGGWSQVSSDGQALLDWLPRLSASQGAVFACSNRGEVLRRIELPRSAVRQAA